MRDELIPSDHLLTRIGVSPEWLPDPEERRRAFWNWGKVQFDDVIGFAHRTIGIPARRGSSSRRRTPT
jgi:hypothetical protein